MDAARLNELEKEARKLEPDARSRAEFEERILDYVNRFLNDLPSQKAFYHNTDEGKALEEHPLDGPPLSTEEIIQLIREEVDRPGLNAASGGHLGYIPGGGIPFSGFGDLIAAISNRYAGVYFASPGAVRMEQMLIDWMAKLVGFSEKAGGNLASGGSIANLTGIVTAREAHGIRSSDIPRTVIYGSPHMHHCLDKAIRIAGLSEAVFHYLPLDDHHRMDPEAFKEQIVQDRKNGLTPWLLIGSAGTTDTGSIDPLEPLGSIANEEGLWFHVDGAYGGFFLLCDEGRKKLKGIEKADSVVLDPHKGLFLPYGTGALIVKDQKDLYNANYYQADYMQDALDAQPILSPADLSPELTKHFRGMRLWLPLKLHGLSPFVHCLEEKLELAKYFYEGLNAIEAIEPLYPPELSVVPFRVVPRNGDPNEATRRLTSAIQKDGRVFLSSSMVDGNFILRAAILSFRTHKQTIDTALEVIEEKLVAMGINDGR